MAKTKVMITVDEDLLRDVDDYCDKNYLNRSAFFNQSVSEKINTQKLINAISDVAIAMKRVAESGDVDKDFEQKYQTFKSVAQIFTK